MSRRAAAYLRVSSAQQADEDRFGYHRQIAAIREYAARNDIEIVAEYRDAITGKSVTRVGLDALIVASHGFDCALISSVDRLARDVTSSYQVLANLLAGNLQVHSADQGLIDLEQESSLIQFNLQSLFAHLERQKIVKRTLSARIAIAKAGGIPDGRRMLGYRTVDRKAVIVEDEAVLVRELYARSAAGETLYGIATALRDREEPRIKAPDTYWRFTDVGQIIKNPAYRGEMTWRSFVLPVPPIVEASVWHAAQPRSRGRPKRPTSLVLLGHLRCGQCGYRVTSHSQTTKRPGIREPMYRCTSHSMPGRACALPQIKSRLLEPLVEELVRSTVGSKSRVRALLDAARQESAAHMGTLAALEAEDARWLEAFRAGAITARELSAYRGDVARRRTALLRPGRAAERPVEEYVAVARSMEFRELLEFAGIEVVLYSKSDAELRLHAC